MPFCNTIKFTQSIFLSSKHATLLKYVVIQVHELLFSKDLQFSQLRYFPFNLFVLFNDWCLTSKRHQVKHPQDLALLSLVRTKRFDLLFHTEVRWLSRVDVMSQKDETSKFFDCVDMEQSRKFFEKLSDKASNIKEGHFNMPISIRRRPGGRLHCT